MVLELGRVQLSAQMLKPRLREPRSLFQLLPGDNEIQEGTMYDSNKPLMVILE